MPEPESSKALILFIHGLGGHSTGTWGKFPDLIRADPQLSTQFDIAFYAYPSSVLGLNLVFWRRKPRIQLAAAGLRTEIDVRYSNYARIVLVSHSLGGLVARKYLLEEILDGRQLRVTQAVLFAVPNDGADLARFGKSLPITSVQVKQVCKDSDFIAELNTAWARPGMRERVCWLYVRAGRDSIVDERSTAGYWGNPNVKTVIDADHLTLVKPKDADDLTFKVLTHFLLDAPSVQTTAALQGIPDDFAKTSNEDIAAIVESVVSARFDELTERLDRVERSTVSSRSDGLSAMGIDEAHHEELNFVRDLVNTRKPIQALEHLSALRQRIWDSTGNRSRYRILHYTGFASNLLGREHEAGTAFVDALPYSDHDDTAFAFAGLGYLLLGDKAQAEHSANLALEKNPANGMAYTVLVEAANEDTPFEEVLARIPEPRRTIPEVSFSLASAAGQRHSLDEAERWARATIANEEEEKAEPLALLGSLLVERATSSGIHPFLYRPNPDSKAQLEEATERLQRAWELIKETEMRPVRLSWLVNRAVAQQLLGHPAIAAACLDEALVYAPSDAALLTRRALIALERGDKGSAIEFIRRSDPSSAPVAETVYQARVLAGCEDYEGAREWIEAVEARQPDPSTHAHVMRLRVELAMQSGDIESATQYVEQLLAADPGGAISHVVAATLFQMRGELDRVRDLLGKAESLVTTAEQMADLHAIADVWYGIGDYVEAARVFERIADKDALAPATERLLISYYKAGELGLALDLGRHLLELYGPTPRVSELVVAILEEVDDLKSAREVGNAYLTAFPPDFRMRLRMAMAAFRSRDESTVDAFLSAPMDVNALELDDLNRIAQLYAYRGRLREALQLAYETRRRFFGESESHLVYVSLFFTYEHADLESLVEPGIVSADSAVNILGDDGASEWHIIEDRADGRLPLELPLGHPLATKLLGKRVGESIVLYDSEMSTQTATVAEIKSKYVYALHESMHSFQRMFPDATGLWNVRLPSTDAEGAEPDFKPILDMLTRKQDLGLKVEALYRQGQATLGMCAKIVGSNPVATWSRFVSRPDVGIRASRGDRLETAQAKLTLDANVRLVIDPVSILTIHLLDVKLPLAARFGKFLVAQATIDMLHQVLEDHRPKGSSGHMAVWKEGDQHLRDEITPDDTERGRKSIEDLVNWIDVNCEVVPVTSVLANGRERREALESFMDDCFGDTVLIASEPDRVLYSDDERLRSLGAAEFGCKGVWTQVLLEKALEENVIGQEAHNQAVVRLVDANYRHTSINAQVLMAAAEISNWLPDGSFSRVAAVLSSDHSDEASALSVAGEGMYLLWLRSSLPPQRRVALATSILRSLCTGRNREACIGRLLSDIARRFWLLPDKLEEASKTIVAWAAGTIG